MIAMSKLTPVRPRICT